MPGSFVNSAVIRDVVEDADCDCGTGTKTRQEKPTVEQLGTTKLALSHPLLSQPWSGSQREAVQAPCNMKNLSDLEVHLTHIGLLYSARHRDSSKQWQRLIIAL